MPKLEYDTISGFWIYIDSDLVLQDAVVKDTLERATDTNLNLRSYLQGAYVHPVFHSKDIERPVAIDEEENDPLVPTKRNSNRSTPGESKHGSEVGSEIEY